MSEENVEAFKRFVDAFNRRDLEAILAEVDPSDSAPLPVPRVFSALIVFKDAKATEIRSYLDPKDALEAAGLSE